MTNDGVNVGRIFHLRIIICSLVEKTQPHLDVHLNFSPLCIFSHVQNSNISVLRLEQQVGSLALLKAASSLMEVMDK